MSVLHLYRSTRTGRRPSLRWGPDRRPFGTDAVSDVVGSILLVGITVVMAAGLATIIFTTAKPLDPIHADVVASADAGLGGWGTGDEHVLLSHLGGETIKSSAATLTLTIGGVRTVLTGAALGSAFSDGKFTIGEVWTRTQNIPPGTAISAALAVTSPSGAGSLVASLSALADCSGDISPPTALSTVQAAPNADVNTGSIGAVVVTITLTDNCVGVAPSPPPKLYWRVTPNAFSNPPLGMTNVAPPSSVWTATIPSQNWPTLALKNLEYYMSPVTDTSGNTGQTATAIDVIEDTAQYTYVTSSVNHVGTVAALSNAQIAADGSLATLQEAGQTSGGTSTTTVPPLAGTTATMNTLNSGVANDALTSDNQAAGMTASGSWVQVTGFSLPGPAATVSAVSTGFEGMRKPGSSSPEPSISVSFTATGCTPVGGTWTQTVSNTADQSFSQPVTTACTWTVAMVNSMAVRTTLTNAPGKEVTVDQIFVTVTYATAGPTTYNMTLEFKFANVPTTGTTHTVDLSYKIDAVAPTETYQVLVWNGASWNQRGATLSSPSLFQWTYALSNVGGTEFPLSGLVKIRFVDVTPTQTTQHSLFIEYARVVTI